MYRWYATPTHKPDHLIAGPFEDRDSASRECVRLTSEVNKQRTAYGGTLNVTQYYLPRLVRVQVSELVLKPIEIEPSAVPAEQQVLFKLTAKLQALSLNDLMRVCSALGIAVNFKPRKDSLISLIKENVRD